MQEGKYTPGEWRAVHFDALMQDETGTLIPAGHKKRMIQAVRMDEHGRRCTQFLADIYEQAAHTGQAEANARLIAAAPELLEVAKEALASRQTHDADGIEYEWAVRARAALSKATGNEGAV